MKRLTLIIHTDDEQSLTKQLRVMEHIQGFTLSHTQGHGVQSEHDAFLSARDKVVGSSPRIRIDIILQNADLDTTLHIFSNAKNKGEMQAAYYWVTAVEQEGHI